METRKQSRRAASKEALKQLQLISAYDEGEEDSTETYEITSDEEVVAVEQPPKKKYRLSHRKSSDGNDRDVLVLQTVTNAEETLKLEVWPEELSEAQKAMHEKIEKELKDMNARIDQMVKQTNAEMIYQSDVCTAFQVGGPPSLTYTGIQPQPNVMVQQKSTNAQTANYQLVMDPRLGLIVGTMTPTTANVVTGQQAVTSTTPIPTKTGTLTPVQTRQRKRGRPMTASVVLQAQQKPISATVITKPGRKSLGTPTTPTATMSMRPTESSSVGGLSTGTGQKTTVSGGSVVDLTSDDGRPLADSREISFNKLQGKTFPSLVVVARPHLRVKDSAGGDRSKLDSKVKAVLMHVPTKFTEWLIQQGLVRSEQTCSLHTVSKLKLGMYSDVSKFPYSGGYVWISECCPTRFVSVFSGSLFEGSPHPPSVILKLIYHWACQTNVQNVVQWVKVDNLYVKGLNTWLRAACTVALHTHVAPLGGPGRKVEVGVISLGTTSQDGHQRQVKVEVLGLLETENKLLRLRAVEPLADGDRNYKKRFSKILEPILQWVHPESVIVTDLTVDKGTLHNMGFKNVQQTTSTDNGSSNQTIMEYLRRIVPRMFQNTLSLLSRQIIQQFLDELVWREWFGTTAVQAFDNMVVHLSEQTRCDTGQTLILRLNKVAANPFKNWSVSQFIAHSANTKVNSATNMAATINEQPKRYISRTRAKVSTPNASSDLGRPSKSSSPDVPQQMVPLENYYYGTINSCVPPANNRVSLNMKCCMCKSFFYNNIVLMLHLFSHAHSVQSGSHQCRYCLASVATSDGLEKHVSSSHPTETRFGDAYICVICETQFQNPYSLGKHMSREHNPAELPYACGSCGFRCSAHKQAVDHFYQEHNGAGTIQCPFCLRSTTIHSGRQQPQNVTYFLQHLQKHQKKALAKKCGQCALWFVQKESLKDHQSKMHDSQRHKEGFVPWQVPRNCIMVPKSRQDERQPVVENNINFGKIVVSAANVLNCKECKKGLTTPGHFPSFESCTNNNCQYSTCCASALTTHKTICKNLNESLPIQTLPFEMFCVCGYSDSDGNTLAKHLAICERKSAYASAEKAKAAIVNHSMLDVLGLVRRPEEPSGSKEEEGDEQPQEKKKKRGRKKKIENVDEVVVNNRVEEKEVETEEIEKVDAQESEKEDMEKEDVEKEDVEKEDLEKEDLEKEDVEKGDVEKQDVVKEVVKETPMETDEPQESEVIVSDSEGKADDTMEDETAENVVNEDDEDSEKNVVDEVTHLSPLPEQSSEDKTDDATEENEETEEEEAENTPVENVVESEDVEMPLVEPQTEEGEVTDKISELVDEVTGEKSDD